MDLGQLPSDHVFHINTLELRIIDNEIQAVQKQQSRLALAHKTHILASIRDHQQLQQPIAILSREVFGSMCNDAQTHAILQFSVRGTCQHIRHMQILFQPIHNQTTSTEAPPSLYPVYINDNTFACSTNHLFSTLVESIEVRFIVDTGEYLEIDIHDLQLVPVAIQNQVTRLYDDNESESVGFHTIDTIKKEVNDLRQIAQVIQKTPGPTGPVGKRGAKGERGEPMRFEDLDAIQKEELRGQRGLQGPRGKAMVFEDLSSEQRILLEGEKGETGESGKDGERGP